MVRFYEPLDWDTIRAQTPGWYFQRFDLSNTRTGYFIVPIPVGFCYLLRSVRTKWPDIESNLSLEVEGQFTDTTADRTKQNVAYPLSLISTPGKDGVSVVTAPAPVNMDNFGVCFTATGPKKNITLNYYYQRRGNLDVRINFNVIGSLELGYVDILFIGYLMPDKDVDFWG